MKYRNHIIIVVLFLVSLFALDKWFTHRYRNDSLYKTQWIHNIKDKRYDYAVLGASHAYMGFDVALADSMLGMKGINLALDGSHIGTQSVLTDIFLNRNHNAIEYLFVCVDNPTLANSEMQTDISDGRMMPFLDYPEVWSLYRDKGKHWYFDRYFPMWKYAEYNYYWGPHVFLNTFTHIKKQDFDPVTGSMHAYDTIYTKTDTTLAIIDFSGSTAKYRYLNKVVDLCREKNIRPVFFCFPLTYADTTDTARANVARFTQYWQEKNVPFIYMGDMLNYELNYFRDKAHLNKRGAEYSTAELVRRMKAMGLL
jgi:hypothetical protein